jgi:hypothetical protein
MCSVRRRAATEFMKKVGVVHAKYALTVEITSRLIIKCLFRDDGVCVVNGRMSVAIGDNTYSTKLSIRTGCTVRDVKTYVLAAVNPNSRQTCVAIENAKTRSAVN